MSETVYLSLGSNLGDRASNLTWAVEQLAGHPDIEVLRLSSLYETEPQDVAGQPWFLNMAVSLKTNLQPHTLLQELLRIEGEGGRRRPVPASKGPRTLDLDILLYGDRVIQSPELTVPHPRMRQRRFVLEPLLEIKPDLVDAETHRPLAESLAGISGQVVRRWQGSNRIAD